MRVKLDCSANGSARAFSVVALRGTRDSQRASMSRIEIPSADGRTLIGTFNRASDESVLVLAHGFASDRGSRGRFPPIAEAASRLGISCLAFDFAGCGESTDAVVDPSTQRGDMMAALAEVRRRGFRRVGAWGHSLGSVAVWRAAREFPLDVIVATGGLTAAMPYEWSEHFPSSALRALQETGVVPVASPNSGRVVRVGKALLDDMTGLDTDELLSGVACPALMIHGNGDEEERALLARSHAALETLPAGSRVELLEGATHGFPGRFSEAITLALPFVASRLCATS